MDDEFSLRSFLISDAIVRFLIACDSKFAALENEARLHEELFRAMLEELMSGRHPAGTMAEPESGSVTTSFLVISAL
jgi:hypothetical protein